MDCESRIEKQEKEEAKERECSEEEQNAIRTGVNMVQERGDEIKSECRMER
jgi:hypothetical protein